LALLHSEQLRLLASAFSAADATPSLIDPAPRDDGVVRPENSNTPVNEDEKTRLTRVQQAVRGIRALQQEIGKRKGFKPITDKEVRDAKNHGRP
jgi:hypothetical protein